MLNNLKYLPLLRNIAIIFGGGLLLIFLIQWANQAILNIPVEVDAEKVVGFEWIWVVGIPAAVVVIAVREVWTRRQKSKVDQDRLKNV